MTLDGTQEPLWGWHKGKKMPLRSGLGAEDFGYKRNKFRTTTLETASSQRAQLIPAQTEMTLDVSSLLCSAGRLWVRGGVCDGFANLELTWRAGNPHPCGTFGRAVFGRLSRGRFIALQTEQLPALRGAALLRVPWVLQEHFTTKIQPVKKLIFPFL